MALWSRVFVGLAAAPLLFALAQPSSQDVKKAEDVYKDIQVFKGLPAEELIPAMEFMSGALKFECTDCHDAKNYAADTEHKTAARHMILMQREINAKNFNGRTEVTCMTCHRGSEHPASAAIPDGAALRHRRMENAPKAEDLFAKSIAAVGPEAIIIRTGTLTAPNDETHKIETKPAEFIQAPGGKFRLTAGDRVIVSDGAHVWYGGFELDGEPAAVFKRLGFAWRGADAFAGLDRLVVAGQDTVDKAAVIVVRGARPSMSATQEIWLDAKTHLVRRLVNMRRSTLGTVVSQIEYGNYRSVGGSQTPMTVVYAFPGETRFAMTFKSAKKVASVPASTFTPGG